MKRRNIFYAAVALFAMTLTSCDEVDKADRYIYVEPATVARRVLVEDFTGQKCNNCPTAHEELERLQTQYGSDNVIAVSIHAGALAVGGADDRKWLKTELGEEYNTYWKVEAWPMGLVNRVGGVAAHTNWGKMIYDEIQKPTYLELSMTPTYNETTRELTVAVEGKGLKDISGKLQLWLTEDNIVANQIMPDGSLNREYVHSHVLRTAINGTWGTDFNVAYGQTTNASFTTTLKGSWDAKQITVIAFVYNSEGVQQVIKTKIQ